MTNKSKQSNNIQARPPVVVVLGHVDHGKSSILEAIKDLKITDKESGGITQHIAAYEIEHQDKKITFIDTPGHAAFTAMRSRGVKVADIAVLVIAGEEGIKPQTKEVISHIKEAEIPMIVAVNKIDKPEADAEKVKRELSDQDILVESWGGKVPSVEISAKTGKGINELLEMILLVAEMEDFKTDISASVQGAVIESHMDVNRGPTTTLIIQKGVLEENDILGSNSVVGKVKRMEDFQGKTIKKAFPSQPIIVLGFEDVPGVGEEVKVYSDIEEAKKEIKNEPQQKKDFVKEDRKVLNLILKVDVLGSLEAINEVLKALPQEKSVFKVLKGEVGEINESDVKLAVSAKAKIIGFRVKINPIAQRLIEREKITTINFEVIYELAEAVKNLLEKIIAPEKVRDDLGKVEVLAIFRNEKSRQILGCKVIEGRVKRGASLEVYRDEEEVGKGKIIKLQKEKKEIGEMAKGLECGILYEGDVKIEEGDILNAYIIEKRKII